MAGHHHQGEGWNPQPRIAEPDQIEGMVGTMAIIFEEACEITTIGLALLELGGWDLLFQYQPILYKIRDSGQDGFLCYQLMQGSPTWKEHKETIKNYLLLKLRPASQRTHGAVDSKRDAFDMIEQIQPRVILELSLSRP